MIGGWSHRWLNFLEYSPLDPDLITFKLYTYFDAGVAQLVEQETLNLLVVGSSPSAGTIIRLRSVIF